MKFVYVLTSTEKDLYYEQALMSAYSFRLHNPTAELVVLVDDKTNATLVGKRAALKTYATEIISVPFEDSVPNLDRSRLIKTAIPDYVHDDFLYLDCDTIICDDLSAINDIPFETAGVLDGHSLLDAHIHRTYFLQRDKKLGFHATAAQGYSINGGLVLCRNTEAGRELFRQWNEIWKYSAYTKHDKHDQSALNEANYRTGGTMQLLDGIWNCQPGNCGLAYLKDAKILHYFSSEMSGRAYIPYYKLAQKDIQERVKEAGDIPEDIRAMIRDPKLQFNAVHIINDDRIVSIMQSPLTFTLADIRAKFPRLFRFFEVQTAFVRGIAKKFKK